MQINWKNIFLIIHPDQYIKNTFIFLPLFFELRINEFNLLLKATIAFIAFSMICSSVYILNDLHDIEDDRLHPKKKLRPIASGAITKLQSSITMVIFFLLGLALSFILIPSVTMVLMAYFVLNIFYTFYLKKVPIIDVATIAIFFVIRVLVGSIATDVSLSEWIVVLTFLLALFLALAKRRDDVKIFTDTGNKMRKVVDNYTLQFLDISTIMIASVVIVAYIVVLTSDFTVEKYHSQYLYLTALFVIVGIMRYLQFVFVINDAGSPTKIVLKDRFMQLTILCWGFSFVFMIY